MSKLNLLNGLSDKPISLPDNANENSVMEALFIFEKLFNIACIGALTYVGIRGVYYILEMNDNSKSVSALNSKKALAKRLNRPEIEQMDFNKHEEKIMLDVIGADEINVSFADIGGMDKELEEVKDNIVLPFQIYK